MQDMYIASNFDKAIEEQHKALQAVINKGNTSQIESFS